MIRTTEYRKDVKEVRNTGSRRYYAGSILMTDELGRCVDATYVNHYGAQIIADSVIDGSPVALLIQDKMGSFGGYFDEADTGRIFWTSRASYTAYTVERLEDGSRWRLATYEELKALPTF